MRSVFRRAQPAVPACRAARVVAPLPTRLAAGSAAALFATLLAAAPAARAQPASDPAGVGVAMVAASPPAVRGNDVTLWDEIAPPAPLPEPADALQQAAQATVVSDARR